MLMADRNRIEVPVSAIELRRDCADQKVENMNASLRKYLWTQVACLSLCLSPLLAFTQSSGFAQNRDAGRAGRE